MAWALVAWLRTLDALAMRDYVALLDNSATLPADSLPLTRSAPTEYSDAHTWLRYALAAQEGAPWRIRHTDIDNAPAGRDVHWNSAFVHLIAAAGRARQLLTGESLAAATERALAWFNLPILVGIVILFSSWVGVRTGAAAGVLIALAMPGFRWFYDGFAPNYVDHHGLLTAAAFGVTLGVVFMGAGWRRSHGPGSLLPRSERQMRTAAVASAVSGAIGMWISAASMIPTIAAVGVAGAIVAWWLGKRATEEGAEFDGDAWRLWGRIGCGLALLAYLVEYAPHDLAMRLEVNHPLYALAWLGGAELVAFVGEWRTKGVRGPGWRIALSAALLFAPVVVIAIGGSHVFAPLDHRVAQLHAGIEEFYSLPALIRALGADTAWRFAVGGALVLPVALTARANQRDRILVAFASIVTVALVALACWQVRWWLMASGAELSLLLVAWCSILGARSARVQWVAALLVGAFFVEQFAVRIHTTRANVDARGVTAFDAWQPVYRDAAVVLRASNPGGRIVLLASPNASTGIGYFGRIPTLASLYWENMPGLEAAAEILSATNDDSAYAQIRARGVTHIVSTSSADFLRQYLALARPSASESELPRTLGYRLLTGGPTPTWVRPIPFRPRLPGPDDRALVYQVDPNQTEFEHAWNTAIASVAAGRAGDAAREFRDVIAHAGTERRADLYQTAGQTAYRWHEHALAVRLLDSAMALRPSNTVAANLAWILATSVDDRVRDGRTAVEIASRLVREQPADETTLDVFAAALAESRRYADAVVVAQRMSALASSRGDRAAASRADERLRAYRAGRPWRQ